MKIVWLHVGISSLLMVFVFVLFAFIFPVLRIEECNSDCIRENYPEGCECTLQGYDEPFEHYTPLRLLAALLGGSYYYFKNRPELKEFAVSSMAILLIFGMFYLAFMLTVPEWFGIIPQ
ncbi:hypothetical protein GF318_01835 [Candidatus Micrarchaeota archaeon]|nr:hypothetical protein [Candidatus Micrarchaeota archaeon]